MRGNCARRNEEETECAGKDKSVGYSENSMIGLGKWLSVCRDVRGFRSSPKSVAGSINEIDAAFKETISQ